MILLFGGFHDPFSPTSSFDMIGTLFPIFFMIVLGIIIFQFVRGIGEWSSNNKQPVLTVSSKVVSRRTEVSRTMHNTENGHHHHSTSTIYYATFEVESGDRMELRISGREYGLLAEGDVGKLTFQGTRYHGFERVASV